MRELSLNVMDIVQNSISANASLITISVLDSVKDACMEISIEDNGRGMSEEQVLSVIDPFFTTRTTRKVGLGVPLFKLAAEQTGGSFTIDSKLGEGTKLCAKFVTNHLDMTPLGDINSTISILIRCNPDIDFIFRHKTDLGEFELDTRALREILGEDVSLNNNDVIEWIEGYIEENTQPLYDL